MKQAIFFEDNIEVNFLGHIMAEVYKDKVYAPFVQGKKDLVIVDIGANVGLTSYYFSQFAKQVYSVEPSLEHFDNLSMMVDFNKLTNVKPIKKAIYIKKGKLPFGGPKDNKTMKSLHTATWQEGKPTEEVECLSLSDLFEEEKIDHVDIMKLDVEGTEVEILSSSGFRKVADKIDMIIGEIHNWSGRHPNQIVEALKNNGFSFEQIPNDATMFVARKLK